MFNKKEYQKAYYLKNKEKASLKRKTYYLKNKEKASLESKEYYKNNKESLKAYQKEYAIKHPDYKKSLIASKIATIYCISNIINNKIYIGSTKKTLHSRWLHHKYHIKEYPHLPLYSDMAKYGFENFTIKELGKCAKSDALKCEQIQINYFKNAGFTLYNERKALRKPL